MLFFSCTPSGLPFLGYPTQGSASLHPWATILRRFAAQELYPRLQGSMWTVLGLTRTRRNQNRGACPPPDAARRSGRPLPHGRGSESGSRIFCHVLREFHYRGTKGHFYLAHLGHDHLAAALTLSRFDFACAV